MGLLKCTYCGALLVDGLTDDTFFCEECGRDFFIYGDDLMCKQDDPLYDEVYGDDIPDGCLQCGGDYPNCVDSCNLMSD